MKITSNFFKIKVCYQVIDIFGLISSDSKQIVAFIEAFTNTGFGVQ